MTTETKEERASKNKANRLTLYMIGVLLIIGIGIVMNYAQLGEKAERLKRGYFSETSFIYEYIIEPSYGLYYRMQEIVEEKDLLPQDVYVKRDGALRNSLSESQFNTVIEDRLKNVIVGHIDFDYYVEDHKTGKYFTNIEDGKDGIKQEGWQDKYRFYVVINYNEEGKLTVGDTNIIGDKELFKHQIEELQLNQSYAYTDVSVPIEPIRDTTFFYGINKGVNAYSSLMGQLDNYNSYKYDQLVYKLIIFPVIITIVLAFLCPYEKIIQLRWLRFLIKIPIEILGTLFGYIILSQMINAPYVINRFLDNGDISFLQFIYIESEILSRWSIQIIQVVMWMIVYGSIWITVWLIKIIYHEGLKAVFLNYSLIGWVYLAIKKKNKRTIESIRTINLAEMNRGILFKKALQHGWLLGGFCCLWFFGIVGVILYMVVSYELLVGVMEAIKKDYEKLLEKASSLAEGKLEIELLEEDLGMFEPLKGHIGKIQMDFRQSIEEEMRSQKMKTDLITNVSHDLKTPLTSIISYVDLLKQEDLNEEKRKQYIDTLERKANRLQVLIEDLFEMSKASSGSIIMNQEKVEVVSLIKQTLFELEDKIDGAGITFRTRFPEYKVYLELDSVRTFRVFDNLINNIVKYAMPHSRAYIEVEDQETSVVITLKNVAREELDFDTDQITERFIRGDKSRHTEGSGLGLAIAKSFIELQGGKLKVDVDGDLFKVSVVFEKCK